VRGTFDWGVLDEKRAYSNTNIGRSKRDFGPTSVIRGIIVSVPWLMSSRDEVCVESKAAECTKKDPCQILAIGVKFLSSRRIYSRVSRDRNTKHNNNHISCS
jgi:hypothetical protein